MNIILFYIFFIFSGFLAFYIPGRVALGKAVIPFWGRLVASIGIGIALWTLQGIIFGFLQLRLLSYVYLFVLLIFFISQKYHKEFLRKGKITLDIPAIMIGVVGVIGQILPFIQMGTMQVQGISIIHYNNHDHIWHAALVEELIRHFPPQEPALSGVLLQDYHFFYNLVTAELIRVFHLPFFSTIFLGMYPFASILLGLLTYMFATKLYPSKMFARLALFFAYFAGDAVGWVLLVMHNSFNWDVGSIINNAAKFVDGPPYAYAMILVLTGLYLLLWKKEEMSKSMMIVLAIIFGLLIEFKIYVGLPIMLGLGAYSMFSLIQKKIEPIISFIFAGILSTIFFKLFTSSSAGLIFLPFEIPRNFINLDIFHLLDWQLRWVIFQQHHNIPRMIEYGIIMTAFYLLVQFGIQLLGLFPLKKTRSILGIEILVFFYTVIISGLILAFGFYQTVGGSNIWEFLLPVLFFLGFILSLNITVLLEKRSVVFQIVSFFVLAIIVLPRWIFTENFYISFEYLVPFHGVSYAEVKSYDYIAQKTPQKSLIMTINQEKYTEPTTVANLFMQRDTYFTGLGVRETLTPEMKKRMSEVTTVATSTSSNAIQNILKSDHISYVYVYKNPTYSDSLQRAGLEKVFSNDVATIYKVK